MVTTNATPMLPARHSSAEVSSVITITGLGDHDQPDWLITMAGIRMQTALILVVPGECVVIMFRSGSTVATAQSFDSQA